MDNGDNGLSIPHAVSHVERDLEKEAENVMHLLQPTVERIVLV